MHLHMDGARFANACVSLSRSPADITWKAGVDVLCFGGTKNGRAVGEAVVFFNKDLATDFEYRCKQAGQLASKMRFLAAPHVRERRVAPQCSPCECMCPTTLGNARPTDPTSKFSFLLRPTPFFSRRRLKRSKHSALAVWRFYTFIGGGARFMFAWDSSIDRVNSLAEDILQTL